MRKANLRENVGAVCNMFLTGAMIVGLIGCGQSIDVKLEEAQSGLQKQSEEQTIVDTKWKQSATEKRGSTAFVQVAPPYQSKSDGGRLCPANTVCIRAPYIGSKQFGDLVTHPEYGSLFRMDSNPTKNIVVSLTGKSEVGGLDYFFEADIVDLEDNLVLRSDGRNVIISASEITGKGVLDVSALVDGEKLNSRRGRTGGSVVVFAPKISAVTIKSQGQDGQRGFSGKELAAGVPERAADGGRGTPQVSVETRSVGPFYIGLTKQGAEYCKKRYDNRLLRPASLLVSWYGWGKVDFDRELERDDVMIVSGAETIIPESSKRSGICNGEDARMVQDGQSGGEGGGGGNIEVFSMSGSPAAVLAPGGKGASGGAGFTQLPGRNVAVNKQISYTDWYSFKCIPLVWRPTNEVSNQSQVGQERKCRVEKRTVVRSISVRVAGVDGKPCSRSAVDGRNGTDGKDGVCTIYRQLERSTFLEQLGRKIPFAGKPEGLMASAAR